MNYKTSLLHLPTIALMCNINSRTHVVIFSKPDKKASLTFLLIFAHNASHTFVLGSVSSPTILNCQITVLANFCVCMYIIIIIFLGKEVCMYIYTYILHNIFFRHMHMASFCFPESSWSVRGSWKVYYLSIAVRGENRPLCIYE